MFKFTHTYEIRLTYLFDKGGTKSAVYKVKAKDENMAILAAKTELYDTIGYPTPDGKLEIDYCNKVKGA